MPMYEQTTGKELRVAVQAGNRGDLIKGLTDVIKELENNVSGNVPLYRYNKDFKFKFIIIEAGTSNSFKGEFRITKGNYNA